MTYLAVLAALVVGYGLGYLSRRRHHRCEEMVTPAHLKKLAHIGEIADSIEPKKGK